MSRVSKAPRVRYVFDVRDGMSDRMDIRRGRRLVGTCLIGDRTVVWCVDASGGYVAPLAHRDALAVLAVAGIRGSFVPF